ncbi:fimbrial protein [Serratia marcescens]|uniref:fimbrial protein n=1 Tax=Serratia marcescens TaxID=615 RepID=UPI000975EBF1|nr:fimbrial protein [Serratia marcescens]MDY7605653.1 fimbrial protein [Serratia marcescens]OMP54001.1 exotoxin [Serratia marcescens]
MNAGKSCRPKPAWYAAGLVLVFWGGCFPALAKTATATVTVKITLTAPPCDVNDNKLIEVNFGNDVMTTRVDGEYKKMPINYTLKCQGGASNAVRMRIDGQGAAFDGGVLKTNKTDFGIELLNSGKRLPINGWLNFTYPNQPTLEAVPVKRSGARLSGGAFSASATMKVEYR